MVLLLDIDGVMVAANSWRKLEILEDGFPAFTSLATKALNRILAEMQPGIILTTSHKHKYSTDQWIKLFQNRNIKLDELSCLPENKTNLNRRDEIQHYLSKAQLNENFVIVDDDKSLNALPKKLKDRLVQTSSSVGLTDYLADEVIDKLKGVDSNPDTIS